MENLSMIDIAKEAIGNSSKTFDEIFSTVSKKLLNNWKLEAGENISENELLEKKRGEFYKLLTIDSRFFRNNDGTWTAIRPDTLGRE